MWILLIVVILYIIYTIYQTWPTKKHLDKQRSIQILVRQAARWAIAAHQDKNPMIAILHANYGAGYLWALIDIAKPEEIESATGIDFDQFKKEILDMQDLATGQMARSCPNWAPSTSLLVNIARGEIS